MALKGQARVQLELNESQFAIVYSANTKFHSVTGHLNLASLNSHTSPGGVVLVHCNMGLSRAPMIVMAYLMLILRRTLQDSWNLVRAVRPEVHPNPGFMYGMGWGGGMGWGEEGGGTRGGRDDCPPPAAFPPPLPKAGGVAIVVVIVVSARAPTTTRTTTRNTLQVQYGRLGAAGTRVNFCVPRRCVRARVRERGERPALPQLPSALLLPQRRFEKAGTSS